MKTTESIVFDIPTEILWTNRVFIEKLAEFNRFLTVNNVPMKILFVPVHDISIGWKVGNIDGATGSGYVFPSNKNKLLPSNSISAINFFDINTPREAFAKLITGSSYDKKDRITAWDDNYYYQLVISSSRKAGGGFEIMVTCKEF